MTAHRPRLSIVAGAAAPPPQSPAPDAAEKYARAARAESTAAAYAADWRAWEAHCAGPGMRPPAAADEADVAAYLARRADDGAKPSTLARAAAGIAAGYRARGLRPPAGARLDDTIRGIRRSRGAAPAKAAPLTADLMATIFAAFPPRSALVDVRDRALLAVAWQAALRRSEAVGLDWGDYASGLGDTITLRASKGERAGGAVSIPLVPARRAAACPIRSLASLCRAYERAGDRDWRAGPIFRRLGKGARLMDARLSAQSVTLIVRRRAAAAGVPTDGLSAHSLRSGMLTSAAHKGANTYRLMEHSRHKRSDTLDGYIREARLIADHPARDLL